MANKKKELSEELQKKYDAFLFEFGMKTLEGRKRYKLNQEELAEAAGLEPKSGKHRISLIENGRVPVNITFMMRVADLFGMELQLVWVQKKKGEARKKAITKDDSQEFPETRTEPDEDASGKKTRGIEQN
jgi:transcriptional regulator with XRE-family HTH domain